MLIGVNNSKIDAKGRLKVPAKLCTQIEAMSGKKMILTLHQEDDCLVLFPESEWQSIVDKVLALPALHSMTKTITRRVIASATECELDSNQRIMVSAKLRKEANLSQEVLITGIGNRCELWNEQDRKESMDKSALLSKDEPLTPELASFRL